MSVNKVILLGTVGQEPTIHTTQDGKKIATFSLATSDKWKDKQSGEMRDKTEWHRVVVFADGLAGIVERYIKKGSKIFVEGSLQTRKWTDNSGVEKYTTEVILQGFNNKLEIIGNKETEKNETQSSSYNETQNDVSGIEDDIPF